MQVDITNQVRTSPLCWIYTGVETRKGTTFDDVSLLKVFLKMIIAGVKKTDILQSLRF